MGASLSEPCTMIDLNCEIDKCDRDFAHAERTGWVKTIGV